MICGVTWPGQKFDFVLVQDLLVWQVWNNSPGLEDGQQLILKVEFIVTPCQEDKAVLSNISVKAVQSHDTDWLLDGLHCELTP